MCVCVCVCVLVSYPFSNLSRMHTYYWYVPMLIGI